MAKKPRPTPSPRSAPGLYLVAPRLEDPSELRRRLDEMLAAADVSAVLLRLPPIGEPGLIEYVKAVAPAVQGRDTALLVDGHPEIVAPTGADGAHLTGLDAFTAAVDRLKPPHIVGVGGLKTRHDAMLAGERGADYLMFGEPNAPRPPFDAIIERVTWWAELFEPPCVAHAESLDEVAALAAAGADFVALGEFVFSDWRGPCAMIQAVAERLSAPEQVK